MTENSTKRRGFSGRVTVIVLLILVVIVSIYAISRIKVSTSEAPYTRERLDSLLSATNDTITNEPYALGEADINRLKAAGLQNPQQDILDDLRNQGHLIPEAGELGGTMRFYPSESYFVGPNTVRGYYEDGHRAGEMLLTFDVTDGVITWRVVEP